VIELYAHPYSANSRKVHWALEEIGVPYSYELVDLMAGAHKKPEFVSRNPLGRVPVLHDDGFVLYESNAILLHLGRRHGRDVFAPADERDLALLHQWLFVQAFDFQPAMQRAYVAKLYASMGSPFDAAQHAKDLGELPRPFHVLEAHLDGRSYVVGDRFGLADIALAEPVGLADFVGFDLAPYPNVQRWFARLAERPAFRKTRPKEET
jgi:glutathione S-transferase